MIFDEEKYVLGERNIVLRSAKENETEAQMLVDYLKTVCGETNFLLVNSAISLYALSSPVFSGSKPLNTFFRIS